jgi:hypothetical protein
MCVLVKSNFVLWRFVIVFLMCGTLLYSCSTPHDLKNPANAAEGDAPFDEGTFGGAANGEAAFGGMILPGKGVLTVVLPGSARSVSRSYLSNSTISALSYTLTLTKDGGTPQPVPGSLSGSVSYPLDPGEWDILVEARDPFDDLVGTGGQSVTIYEGRHSSARIAMEIDADYKATLTEAHIYRESDLRMLCDDYYDLPGPLTIYLENDITVSGTSVGEIGSAWIFDGQGRTITLDIDTITTSYDEGSLFTSNWGTVRNLKLAGIVDINTSYSIFTAFGAVAAANYGTIKNVASTVEVIVVNTSTGSTQIQVGGLTGENQGIIEDCYAGGHVSGSSPSLTGNPQIGGIAGKNTGSMQLNWTIATTQSAAETAAAGGGSPWYWSKTIAIGTLTGVFVPALWFE